MQFLQLTSSHVEHFRHLLGVFARVFEEPETYHQHLPDDAYLRDFLDNESHHVLVALDESETVIGGLVAYELQKFEQNRKEIYVFDLAVDVAFQRYGIATQLFGELKKLARQRGAYLIFVQADAVDEGAVAFYRSIASSELNARHFEIQVEEKS